MAQHPLSLNHSLKGQVLIEALFVIAFLLAFLMCLQRFHLTAQQQIQQKRLSKKQINKQAPWIKSLKRGDK